MLDAIATKLVGALIELFINALGELIDKLPI